MPYIIDLKKHIKSEGTIKLIFSQKTATLYLRGVDRDAQHRPLTQNPIKG